MGKTRLHATCHFYSAVVIKASLLHLFFTNRGRRLGASSRFKTWSLVFWCLLTETIQVIWWSASANQYNYNRPSPDTLTTHNLCSCSKGFEKITLKSIHGFKLGSAKSMFALFYFYFFTFPMIFPLQIQCVCVCAYLLCSNCVYNLCAHASCNFLYGHAIQSDSSTRSRKVRMHRLNEFFPVIAYLWHHWGMAAVTSVLKTFKL